MPANGPPAVSETGAAALGEADAVAEAGGVLLGNGAGTPGIEECALIVDSCGEETGGALALVGPMRMDYAKLVPLVDYIAELVGDRILARS